MVGVSLILKGFYLFIYQKKVSVAVGPVENYFVGIILEP